MLVPHRLRGSGLRVLLLEPSVADAQLIIQETVPLIVVSGAFDGPSMVGYVRDGAEGLVLKTNLPRLPIVVDQGFAIRRRLGKLTPRQVEVLRMVAEGHTTRAIAGRLRLSAKTVESHRGEVMKRLEIHHVVGVVRYAVRVGLVPMEL
jgi:DNA-binding CsgD family transcriptional regulator